MINSFNLYAAPPLFAAALNFALDIWVSREAPKEKSRWTFLLWNTSLGLWNLWIGIGYLLQDPTAASYWYRTYSPYAVRLIAPFFLHFVLTLTETEDRLWNRVMLSVAYLGGLGFLLVDATTNKLTLGADHYYWGYYPHPGPWDQLYGPFFLLVVIFSFVTLGRAMNRTTGLRRNQLKYVFYGALICFGTGVTNFLPIWGIPVYPVGNLFNAIYSLLVAYAVIEYALLDIRVVARRSVVYGAFTGILTLAYISVIELFEHLLGHYGIGEKYVFYTAAAPLTIAFAPALKARIEPYIEEASFWKTYRYPEIFNNFSQAVLTSLDLPTVSQRIIEKISSLLGTSSGAVYLAQSPLSAYFRIAQLGPEGPVSLPRDHPLILFLRERRTEFLKEKVVWQHEVGKEAASVPQAFSEFESWSYALTIPLFMKDHFLGFIALGEKSSGNMFNREDVYLVQGLAKQAAVALKNALGMADLESRQKEIKKNHDTALIGMLATEIAHEVSKPLTRILNEQTRLEGFLKGKSQGSLEKIQKETLRANEIMESFAMLSPFLPLERHPRVLSELLDEAVTTLAIEQDSNIRIIRKYAIIPDVPVNESQMFQIFSNVLQNAWEAMPEGGDLTLSVDWIQEEMRGIAQVGVQDTGVGIPSDLRAKIFEPYFTTKQHRGGRGVGLTLSRAMVERHGGSIGVQDLEPGRPGTRVVVQLPLGEEGNHAIS